MKTKDGFDWEKGQILFCPFTQAGQNFIAKYDDPEQLPTETDLLRLYLFRENAAAVLPASSLPIREVAGQTKSKSRLTRDSHYWTPGEPLYAVTDNGSPLADRVVKYDNPDTDKIGQFYSCEGRANMVLYNRIEAYKKSLTKREIAAKKKQSDNNARWLADQEERKRLRALRATESPAPKPKKIGRPSTLSAEAVRLKKLTAHLLGETTDGFWEGAKEEAWDACQSLNLYIDFVVCYKASRLLESKNNETREHGLAQLRKHGYKTGRVSTFLKTKLANL